MRSVWSCSSQPHRSARRTLVFSFATAAVAVMLAGCHGSSDDAGGAPMSVTNSTPLDASSGVVRSVDPEIVFSVDINPGTATPSNISLNDGSANVSATVSVAGNVVTVHPTAPLKPLTRYTLTVSTRILGQAREALGKPYTLTFSTNDIWWEALPDPPPSVAFNDGAMDAAGNVTFLAGSVVIWHDVKSGWTGPVQLQGAPGIPDWIEVDAAGNAFVFFRRFGPSGSPVTLWMIRYDAVADAWGSPTAISDPSMNAAEPRLAFDASGNAIAVWIQTNVTNTTQNVVANFYAAGSGWGTASSVQANTSLLGTEPRVAVDGNGVAMVAWMERTPGATFTAHATRYDVATGTRLSEAVLTPTQWPRFDGSDLGVDAAGNAIFVLGAGSHLMASRYTAVAGWETFAPISTLDHSKFPTIAVNPAGDAFVGWSEINGVVQPAVWSARYVVGTGWETPVDISQTEEETHFAAIAIDPRGNGIVAWSIGHFGLASRGPFLVWTNRYVAGAGWGTPTLMQSDPAAGASGAMLVSNAAGNVFMGWSEGQGFRSTRFVRLRE